MASEPTLLLVGTADTKGDELNFLRERVAAAGGRTLLMDVGVLAAAAHCTPEIDQHAVAAAAGTTLEAVRASADENAAMQAMARGAAALAARLHAEGRIQGLLALGGTMGTDLALDVAAALPLGVPKVVLSTVAHSALLAPGRIAPDLIAVLWPGGLYGLNRVGRAALAQAAGAAVGAAMAARRSCDDTPASARPLVGMTSLGSSCLSYMRRLKPALEARGYELAVFHTTGMGGRAFESLARQRAFCAVMDFSLQELANHLGGSAVTSGADRLTGAGAAGVPQLVAPGACDMVDYVAWQGVPAAFAGRATHDHNRLIASTSADVGLRERIAHEIGARLAQATGPACLLMPLAGIEAWDREGEAMHDPGGLAAFTAALDAAVPPNVHYERLAAHINDDAFADAALAVFDRWVAEGRIPPGVPR